MGDYRDIFYSKYHTVTGPNNGLCKDYYEANSRQFLGRYKIGYHQTRTPQY